MSNKISNCLWFNDNIEEAASFYTGNFKNARVLQSLKNAVDTPSGKEGSLLTRSFKLEDVSFLALNGGSKFSFNPSVSLMVFCKNEEEANELWEQLSVGNSKVLMALDKYDFSDRYGWLADQYGLTWQVIFKDNPSGQRIIPSLIFTGKLFGRAEEAINFYTGVFTDSSVGGITHYNETNPSAGNEVVYAGFKLNDQWFSIMDGPGEHDFKFNEAFSFIVNCDTQEEIDKYWEKLSADPSSEMCGWLKDKFGVSWQIVPSNLPSLLKSSDPEKSKRAMLKLMNMKKLVIEELQDA